MKMTFQTISVLVLSLVLSGHGESIDACYGDYFPGNNLCTGRSRIEVQSAVFGITSDFDSDSNTCNLNDKICWQDMSTIKPEYYQQIQEACNNKLSCESTLRADWTNIPDCKDILSDYVEIFYFCIQDGSTITPPPSTSATSTTSHKPSPSTSPNPLPTSSTSERTTAQITTTTNNSTEDGGEPGGGVLIAGAIAGIVVGVVLVLALTVIIVLLVIKCRRDPQFASQTKTTVMKPYNMIKGDKKTTESIPSGNTETPPDILRHPHINGHHTKPNIKHQNVKMNRDSSRRSGIGPEIILTPQQAGANPPNAVNIQAIVGHLQEATRGTPGISVADVENAYEDCGNAYEEIKHEYEEISDFDNTFVKNRNKASIKPTLDLRKPWVQTEPKPTEPTLNKDLMNDLQGQKYCLKNTEWNAPDRSSVLEMVENDDLYNNPGEIDQDIYDY